MTITLNSTTQTASNFSHCNSTHLPPHDVKITPIKVRTTQMTSQAPQWCHSSQWHHGLLPLTSWLSNLHSMTSCTALNSIAYWSLIHCLLISILCLIISILAQSGTVLVHSPLLNCLLIPIQCLLISILVAHYDFIAWPTELNSLVISILCLLISIPVPHYDLIVWYNDIIVLVIAKPPVEYK